MKKPLLLALLFVFGLVDANAQFRVSPVPAERFVRETQASVERAQKLRISPSSGFQKISVPSKPYHPKPESKPVAPKPGSPVVKPTPNAGQMVSVLKGKPQISAATQPKVSERVTRIDPKVMPKGYETFQYKKGREAAESRPIAGTDTDSKTLYMKQGRDRAESSPVPVHPTRIKDGRPPASGAPAPETKSHFSQYDRISAPGYFGGGHNSAPPTGLSYRVDDSSRLSTDAVRFRKNSTDLADEVSYRYLINLSEALRDPELRGHRFVVEGHASADGSDYANLLLSQQRANAIYDFLISRGVDPGSLLAVGHGEAHARFASHEPEYLLAQDRQVVVFRLAD